jgi:chromosome segregation ATPase
MDEMNSTFGTEIASLPAPLESYYAQFFTNRQAIVAYEQSYQGEFTSRTNQINADDNQLAGLKLQINSEEQSLGSQLSQIQSDRARLNSLSGSGQTSAYNAAVGPFNAEVNAYNQGVSQLQSDIASYNSLVNSRNAVASDLDGLDSALDTRLTTTPSAQ